MDAKAAHRGVQSALGDELARHWGEIAAIEAGVSRSEGYLSKFCRGTRSIPLNLLLESLEILEVDPGTFFSKALGTRLDPDGFLRDLEQPGREAPVLLKIEKATLRMEAEGSAEVPQKNDRSDDLMAKITRCTVKEQRRRLRTAARYRFPAFARAYLAHLDRLRYEDPKQACKLVEVMATDLVPGLRSSRRERLELQCQTLALYCGAQRLMGGFATAVRAARFALELARRHSLENETAMILRRSASLLGDHGQYQQALILLREAFEIFFDLGSRPELGTTMADRGIMLMYLGDYQASVRALKKVIELLPGMTPDLRKCYLGTYQSLAYCYEQLGDLENAEKWLDQAVGNFEEEGGINWAMLVWHQGRIAYAKGDLAAADSRLRLARRLFDERSAPEGALVCLDLTRVLLAQGRLDDACALARQMAAFFRIFRKNKIAEAAIAEFMRLALEGRLTLSLVDRIQLKLQGGGTQKPGR